MSNQTSENNKRIAKNTLFMYIRMAVIMLVQLYTSRIVLQALGINNYGIYNVVATFIIAFTFLSSPLSSATQRFLSFELGRRDYEQANKVFNLSLLGYVIMALALVIIIEIVGFWFINCKMQIPEGRYTATLWTFQLSLFALVFSLLKTPFDALITSHERMSFYAYMSIVEVLMKLANAILLMYVTFDKLITYAVIQLAIIIIVVSCEYIYSKKQFSYFKIKRIWDKDLFKRLLSFSGWTLLSSVSTMAANQGVTIILNVYCGVVVNAAMGIAQQVSTSINQFVTNFQVSFNPQIVKYYSARDLDLMRKLVYRASKFSYMLLFMIICPVIFNIDFILKIWLKTPPENAGMFCAYLMVWSLLESLMAPLWTSITATGKIMVYHICMSALIILVFLLSWICLGFGLPPESVLIVKCLVDVVLLIVRMGFVKKLLGFSLESFVKEVIIPVSFTTLLFAFPMYFVSELLAESWMKLFTMLTSFVLLYTPVSFYVVLSKHERGMIIQTIKKRFSR